MKVDVAFTADEVQYKDKQNRIGVVIDVLRATSSAIVALKNGCSTFIPITTIDEAREMARKFERAKVLLGGAKRGVKVEGFDLGNSPNDYKEEIVTGKTIIFTSSNGTKAMHELKGAEEVLVASFLNVSAVCNELLSLKSDVLIACSGDFGVFSLGDAVCAGMIIDNVSEHLSGGVERSDAATVAQMVYRFHKKDIRGMLFRSEWGQHLIGLGLSGDIDTCSEIDSAPIVPRFKEGVIRANQTMSLLEGEPPGRGGRQGKNR
jgi:2-phosphosulfolactate phosphatase